MNMHTIHHHNSGQVKMHLPFACQQQMPETTCSLLRLSSCLVWSFVKHTLILTPREGERNRPLTSYLIFQCREPFSAYLTDLPIGERLFDHTLPFAPSGSSTATTVCHTHLTNSSLLCTTRPNPKGRREESVTSRFISSFSFCASSISEVIR